MSGSLLPNSLIERTALRAAYDRLVEGGELKPDPAQVEAAAILGQFAESLAGYRPLVTQSLMQRILSGRKAQAGRAGFYLYGDVGRGKSMLMDLFCEHVAIAKKRRVHFHQFMLEVHARLHEMKDKASGDALPQLARDLAQDCWLLCFDEFHVSNIADAMILGRLFAALFEVGVKVVATSNWPPDQLYKNGLQRDRFLPFIDMIRDKMIVYSLNGQIDHRYEQTRDLTTYLNPLGAATTQELQGLFLRFTHDAPREDVILPVHGRNLRLTQTARGVGFFNFAELCENTLGAADYLAIAECLHTVILDDVPVLEPHRRNETLRFMTLIDTLYEAKVKLYMGSAVPVDRLYPSGEHHYAFQRTLSRLMEMQGAEYRQIPHLG